ncbi:uncharacterized protein LOC142222531 [Haematobia irritans]|uniref:uncharacterized protein LOC142222531 n=1 Tax=Haematobia irritans TaxID=7368 RepID=UPI003F4FB19F
MSSDQEQNGQSPASSPLPEWIEPSVFESVIRDKCPDFKQIKDFKAIPALGAGENYATVMLRLVVDVELNDGSSKNISFMMKTAHDSEFFRQMMSFHNAFQVESDVYREILPEFEEMYKEAGVEVKFGAISYDLAVDHPYILLEDLSTRGFKNMNRLEGLDMDHIKAVLSKLAQWHAASAVRVANKGPYKETLDSGFIKEGARDMMKGMFDGMFKIFLQCAKSYAGVEEYWEAMNRNCEHMIDNFFKVAQEEKQGFCVLNHGDCWSNNVMFQHDDSGKIKETYFVDFQAPRYGSPAQDLYYFLLSSAHYDIKVKNFDYFIKFYHDCLVKNLTLLNYSKKVPTLKDLHIMMYQSGLWGYSTVSGVMGAVLLDPNENAQMDNFFADTDVGQLFRIQMYSNARYRKHAEMLLPWLYNRGSNNVIKVRYIRYNHSKEQRCCVHLDKRLLNNKKFNEIVLAYKLKCISSSRYNKCLSIIAANKKFVEESNEGRCINQATNAYNFLFVAISKKMASPAVIPKWIKSDLFEEVIKKKVHNFREIKEFNVKPGSAAGENYATVMLRVDIVVELIDGSTEPITFMMKTCHDSDVIREMMKTHNMFDIEKSMYEQIVPAFEKLYDDVGVHVNFGPESYSLPTSEPYILLENLSPRGFKNADRREGLDQEHIENALVKLAQWHAASAVYVEHNGIYEDKYMYGFYRPEARPMMEDMRSKLHELFMGCVRKYSNYEVYAEELESTSDRYLDEVFRVIQYDPEEFNVLNHGDFWANNIMFQYDDMGKLKDTYLIDYQLPKYGTPAQDLYYFLISSANYDVKLSKFDHFIRFYHDHLYENLKILNYGKKMPTLRDIHIMLLKYGIWGISTAMGVMTVVLLNPTEDASLEHFMGDNDAAKAFKIALYANPRYRKHMEAVLPWLKNRGAFCF